MFTTVIHRNNKYWLTTLFFLFLDQFMWRIWFLPLVFQHLLEVKSLKHLTRLTLQDRITKSLLHLHKKKKPPSISAQFQVVSYLLFFPFIFNKEESVLFKLSSQGQWSARFMQLKSFSRMAVLVESTKDGRKIRCFYSSLGSMYPKEEFIIFSLRRKAPESWLPRCGTVNPMIYFFFLCMFKPHASAIII